MRIAILVWGSLYWNPGGLMTTGEWFFDGPLLPIEFARISSNRRLTLVIKPNFPPSTTLYATSSFDNLQQARENLQAREGTQNINNIGFVDFSTNTQNARQGNAFVFEILNSWNRHKNFDAIIWSDFPPNFSDRTGIPFTVTNVATFLNGLVDSEYDIAREYIINAPRQINTQFRAQLTALVENQG